MIRSPDVSAGYLYAYHRPRSSTNPEADLYLLSSINTRLSVGGILGILAHLGRDPSLPSASGRASVISVDGGLYRKSRQYQEHMRVSTSNRSWEE